MKRLPFKPQFVPHILSGEKTATARWNSLRLIVGDVVAAVTDKNGNPAWLTPASDAFCHLEVTRAEAIFFKDLTAEMMAKTHADRDWYLARNPTAHDLSTIYYYEFQVVTP